MSITATEITVPTTTATTKPAPKPRVVKPATTKPAPKPVTEATVKQLETLASGLVAAASKSGLELAGVLVELYGRQPWTERKPAQTLVDYFQTTIGVGESGFTLPKPARQEVVKLMATAHPDAPIAHIGIVAGASLSTIARDRREFELANPNRVAAHTQTGDNETGDSETDGGNGDDTTDDKPAKASKTKTNVVNVIAIVDTMSDTQYLMQVIAHASARLSELTTK